MPRTKSTVPTMWVEFTDDVRVLDHNKEVEFEAKKGDVVELKVPSARFWFVRDKAIEAEAPKKTRTRKTSKKVEADDSSTAESTEESDKLDSPESVE